MKRTENGKTLLFSLNCQKKVLWHKNHLDCQTFKMFLGHFNMFPWQLKSPSTALWLVASLTTVLDSQDSRIATCIILGYENLLWVKRCQESLNKTSKAAKTSTKVVFTFGSAATQDSRLALRTFWEVRVSTYQRTRWVFSPLDSLTVSVMKWRCCDRKGSQCIFAKLDGCHQLLTCHSFVALIIFLPAKRFWICVCLF